ncbi:MAG: hypothetical protein KIS95_13960 [Anaerolineae bacterium]|uniref:hypothetical protein n=1 Tax=Promineifilum sp. TaxID=2664178 RepID=UPI001D344DC8|nr:hypothetical protein [Anaerolineales bacterium]MCB8934859.1 hypothetical protein [Promineifilum sp.]MCO5181191.1 hypothetical protein [Promineifilum sp.]MCW5848333.1 hypothetical protein [Anaerolineae bacterium]
MKTNAALQFSSVARRLLSLWVVVAALLPAACRPATATGSAAADPRPYTVYIGDDFLGETFVPIDPATLAARPDGRPLAAPLVSADGATGVDTEMTAGWGSADPATIWIVVYDVATGSERARFHPPAAGMAVGLSADGARLLLQPFPPLLAYPPPVDYYALDAAGGAVAGHVRDEKSACYRQTALVAPDGTEFYCMVDPALEGGANEGTRLEPSPLRIAKFTFGNDMTPHDTGPAKPTPPADATHAPAANPAAAILVGDVVIGQRGGMGQAELIEPALALSPDGRTLAVVDAEADAVTLIDAATLMIHSGFFLQTPVSQGVAQAKGFAGGTLRQAVFSADGRYLYVYSHVLTMSDDEPPGARGLWVVDLARGRVAARALADYQIQWLLPAPDGSVYAFGTTTADLGPYEIRADSPSLLWRLDGATLAVLAERPFIGFRGGRLGR